MSAQTATAPAATGTSEEAQKNTDALSTQGWLLRVESIAIIGTALAVYAAADFQWWMLPVLFLIPDLSMLGYLLGNRTGAAVYNAVHIYATPLTLAGVALLVGWSFGIQFALVWVLHIAADRLLGYGLKYGDSFKHTHLSHI